MLRLRVGFNTEMEVPKRGGCLFIGDEVPELGEWRHPKVFDLREHSINLLEDLDYTKICRIVDLFDAEFTRGDGTLTKDTGLDFIADRLGAKPKTLEDLIPLPDKKSSTGHVWAYGKVQRILRSPVLRRVFCNRTNFSYKKGTTVLARLNRAEFTDFDCRVMGFALMAEYPWQIVLQEGGFYLREGHISLVREKRLMARVDTLGEIRRHSVALEDALLSIEDKKGAGATYADSVKLAEAAKLIPETNEFNAFVQEAMSS